MTHYKLRGIGVLLYALLMVELVHAQWSSDPTRNLPIATRGGTQTIAKIRATSDGGCYVSWYDNCVGGHDVWLQRLDAVGRKQWPGNGVLVSKRSFNWADDYGLAVDAWDNAILAFCRNMGEHLTITAAKVGPDGTRLWGPDGVVVSTAPDVLVPRVAVTDDGHCVVVWHAITGRDHQSHVRLQRLDPDGNTEWGPGLTLTDPDGGDFSPCEVQASGNGSVIVSWIRQPPNTCDSRHLWAQKFDASGAPGWRAPYVVVFDGGSLQMAHFPTFVSDGAGGAVFGWCFVGGYGTDCAVQRILADGSEWLPHNGTTASLAVRRRTMPSVTYNATTDDILIFWEEQLLDPPGTWYAIFGQRIRPDRGREWTPQGRMITPFGRTSRGWVHSLPCADGAMVFFADGPGAATHLYATRLDTKGGFVWTPEIVLTASSYAYRLDAALSSRGIALLAWADGRRGDMDIFGQSIQPDGTLGPGPIAPAVLVVGSTD